MCFTISSHATRQKQLMTGTSATRRAACREKNEEKQKEIGEDMMMMMRLMRRVAVTPNAPPVWRLARRVASTDSKTTREADWSGAAVEDLLASAQDDARRCADKIESCRDQVDQLLQDKPEYLVELLRQHPFLHRELGRAGLVVAEWGLAGRLRLLEVVKASAAAAAEPQGIVTSMPPLDMDQLPSVMKLPAILCAPVPFQLPVADADLAQGVFEPGAPLLTGTGLEHDLDALVARKYTYANQWDRHHAPLLALVQKICGASGVDVAIVHGNGDDDPTGATKPNARTPACVLHIDKLPMLRGEETGGWVVKRKDFFPGFDVAVQHLIAKMRRWSPLVYGALPYTFGYVTYGGSITVVAIDHRLNAHCILPPRRLFDERGRAEVVTVFLNLARLMPAMQRLSKRPPLSTIKLSHLEPNKTAKRTIEVLDDGERVRRTITLDQCSSPKDFKRLVRIYRTLSTPLVGYNTHRQIVWRVQVTKTKLVVTLSPVGLVRRPETIQEVRQWLMGILTALQFWHRAQYCHGDVQWSNVVYKPEREFPACWVLIDMDKSHASGECEIDWEHECKGEKLTYQHDLYQLGRLLQSLAVTDPPLKAIEDQLLASVGTSTCAEAVLEQLRALPTDQASGSQA